jgi:hypothetical protein
LQRWRHLAKHLSNLQVAVNSVKPHVVIDLPTLPARDDVLPRLQEDIRKQLAGLGITIVPTDSYPSLTEVLSLSQTRTPPFNDEHDPRGFHDAVILLACLNYAQAKGLGECALCARMSETVPPPEITEQGETG